MATADVPAGAPISEQPWPHADDLRITGVTSLVTAPEGHALVLVRVDTSEPGLYGWGCATFTQRFARGRHGRRRHVAPLVIGRHPADIEDITRMVHLLVVLAERAGAEQRAVRPGPGAVGHRRQAGRACPSTSCWADGCARPRRPTSTPPARTVEETVERAQSWSRAAHRYVRIQTGGRGIGHYGAPGSHRRLPAGAVPGRLGRPRLPRATPPPVRAGPRRAGRRRRSAARRPHPADAEAGRRAGRALEPYRLFLSRTRSRRSTTTGCRRCGPRRRCRSPPASSSSRSPTPCAWSPAAGSTCCGCTSRPSAGWTRPGS